MRRARGGVPERPKGTGCKPVGSAYGGSNPPAPIIRQSSASPTAEGGISASASNLECVDRLSQTGRPSRADTRAHRRVASRTSSGRSTSGETLTCSRMRTSRTSPARPRSGSSPCCRWLGAGSGCSLPAASHEHSAGCPHVLRLLRGRPGAADVARRRRDADLLDAAAPRPAQVRGDRHRSCSSASSAALRRWCSPPSGFVLAIGRYDVGRYLWIEAGLVVATIVGSFVLFSRSCAPAARALAGPLRAVRLERPLRAAYEGVHGYRRHVAAARVDRSLLTIVVQAVPRSSASGSSAAPSESTVSPRPFFVIGPAALPRDAVPFTVNGIGRSRGLLRQLSREAARARRPGLRDRASLLRALDRASRFPASHPARWPSGVRTRARRRRKDIGPTDPKLRDRMIEARPSAVVIPAYNEEKLLADDA